jgi:hypothetical protein
MEDDPLRSAHQDDTFENAPARADEVLLDPLRLHGNPSVSGYPTMFFASSDLKTAWCESDSQSWPDYPFLITCNAFF